MKTKELIQRALNDLAMDCKAETNINGSHLTLRDDSTTCAPIRIETQAIWSAKDLRKLAKLLKAVATQLEAEGRPD